MEYAHVNKGMIKIHRGFSGTNLWSGGIDGCIVGSLCPQVYPVKYPNKFVAYGRIPEYVKKHIKDRWGVKYHWVELYPGNTYAFALKNDCLYSGIAFYTKGDKYDSHKGLIVAFGRLNKAMGG